MGKGSFKIDLRRGYDVLGFGLFVAVVATSWFIH